MHDADADDDDDDDDDDDEDDVRCPKAWNARSRRWIARRLPGWRTSHDDPVINKDFTGIFMVTVTVTLTTTMTMILMMTSGVQGPGTRVRGAG
jgi:hypothetical protein